MDNVLPEEGVEHDRESRDCKIVSKIETSRVNDAEAAGAVP